MAHPARPRSAADRGLSRPPRARLPGRLHPLARCCGASCPAAAAPGGCSRSRCAWSASARPRSRRSAPREYWTVEALFTTPAGAPFTARLTHLDGKRLDQFDLNTEALAMRAKAAVEAGTFTRRLGRTQAGQAQPAAALHHLDLAAGGLAQARLRRAGRRCGWPSSSTRASSSSGETVGLITYMRTDGVQMAREAISAIREHVDGDSYGRDYLPAAPREYTSKAKNAQEAHEAIRPTDVARTPDQAARRAQLRAAAALRAGLEARRRVARCSRPSSTRSASR